MRELNTGSRKLRVHPLAHNTLQTNARTRETKSDETQCVRPRRVASHLRNGTLVALPYSKRCGHREKCLDERAEDEPQTLVVADFVADSPQGCAS